MADNSKTVLFIGCGGVGINSVSKLMIADAENQYFERASFLTLDGSSANTSIFREALELIGDLDADPSALAKKHWVVPNGRGAGAIRRLNAVQFVTWVNTIYKDIPAADLYIVGYSATGGSGSVIAPELVRLLTADGRNVISNVLLTSDNSEANTNAINVIRGLAAFAHTTKSTCNVMLTDQSNLTVSEADKEMVDNYIALGMAMGNTHKHLDISDIHSFLHSHLLGVPSTLNLITKTEKAEEVDAQRGVLTTLSVVKNGDEPTPKLKTLLNTVGIQPENQQNIYFTASNQALEEYRNNLEKLQKHFTEIKSMLGERNTFDDVGDTMMF